MPADFFHRGPSPLARLAIFGLLSLALLFADTRFRYLENVRQAVAIALYPVARTLEMPGLAFAWVAEYFGSKRQLADENAALRQELVARAPATMGYARVEEENARLRALLDVRSRDGATAVATQVLYAGRDPFSQKVFVDKGTSAGVHAGAGVIDENGVVGQVTRVYPYMAEVTLITDRDQAVPVQVERNGARSVLFGNGTGRSPELRFTSPTADLRVGDRLLTSGLDGTYPPGLAVAEIIDVVRDSGQMFARIVCKPLAGIDHSRFLLVLAPAAQLPQRPEEPSETDAAKKTRSKARRTAP
jgi:rod shape-determining protein MreC